MNSSAAAPKPRLRFGLVLNLAVTVLVICLGPILIGVGTHLIDADEQLERSGVQASGSVVDFHDVSEASSRNMQVEFMSGDGSVHTTWASVDHDQHPVIGEEVTVVYADEDPGRAVVLGYESDGVWFRGVGYVLTAIFGGLGLLFVGAFFRGYLKRDRRKPAV